VLVSESLGPSELSTHPKALFPYPPLRVSFQISNSISIVISNSNSISIPIPILNMYLSQTYSSDDCDEEKSLKTNTN
jgi:hypothetical protein